MHGFHQFESASIAIISDYPTDGLGRRRGRRQWQREPAAAIELPFGSKPLTFGGRCNDVQRMTQKCQERKSLGRAQDTHARYARHAYGIATSRRYPTHILQLHAGASLSPCGLHMCLRGNDIELSLTHCCTLLWPSVSSPHHIPNFLLPVSRRAVARRSSSCHRSVATHACALRNCLDGFSKTTPPLVFGLNHGGSSERAGLRT